MTTSRFVNTIIMVALCIFAARLFMLLYSEIMFAVFVTEHGLVRFLALGLRVWLLLVVVGALWRVYLGWALRLPGLRFRDDENNLREARIDEWYKRANLC